jgi:CheY-like chemotaxis protein
MRILIVEDEPDLLNGLAKALREEGYAVDVAEDGSVGLFKAESTAYDAIVLDVMLPVMDGFELLRRLRETRKTPVLMLTARAESASRVRGSIPARMIICRNRSTSTNCWPACARSSAAPPDTPQRRCVIAE